MWTNTFLPKDFFVFVVYGKMWKPLKKINDEKWNPNKYKHNVINQKI